MRLYKRNRTVLWGIVCGLAAVWIGLAAVWTALDWPLWLAVCLAGLAGGAAMGAVGYWLARPWLRLLRQRNAAEFFADDRKGRPAVRRGWIRAMDRSVTQIGYTQAQLVRTNRRLDGVLQEMDDGVVAVESTGELTLMTRRAGELMGEEQPLSRLRDGGPVARQLHEWLLAVQHTGESSQMELDGPAGRILQIYIAPLRMEKGALAVITDVTRIRHLEQMRREFVANVTHELKTPLTSIRGYVELLQIEKRDPDTEREFLSIIEGEAERLQKLTDDLLELSAIESSTRETDAGPADLEQAVRRALDSLRPEAAARQVKLEIQLEPGLQVAADPGRLYQLVKNLAENAVKYNRPGGRVRICAAHEGPGWLRMQVTDTGIGIPAEDLGRIFERFYRVDKARSREQGGTGLGLSIVKHIATLYGGEVQVSSVPGEGSIFTVWLRHSA